MRRERGCPRGASSRDQLQVHPRARAWIRNTDLNRRTHESLRLQRFLLLTGRNSNYDCERSQAHAGVVATSLAMDAVGKSAIFKGLIRARIDQVYVIPHAERFRSPCQVYYYQGEQSLSMSNSPIIDLVASSNDSPTPMAGSIAVPSYHSLKEVI